MQIVPLRLEIQFCKVKRQQFTRDLAARGSLYATMNCCQKNNRCHRDKGSPSLGQRSRVYYVKMKTTKLAMDAYRCTGVQTHTVLHGCFWVGSEMR